MNSLTGTLMFFIIIIINMGIDISVEFIEWTPINTHYTLSLPIVVLALTIKYLDTRKQ